MELKLVNEIRFIQQSKLSIKH